MKITMSLITKGVKLSQYWVFLSQTASRPSAGRPAFLPCWCDDHHRFYSHELSWRSSRTQLRFWVRCDSPVVQQDVGPPDLAVGESDVGHAGKVRRVPLQVEICPVLQTHTHTHTHTHTLMLIYTPTLSTQKQRKFNKLCRHQLEASTSN